ncbi:MAG: S8 family serine peptidase [Gammaproteobacteria bacterium]|nr:S8 family serine peptidase [Gammaproteobacteria bacterium]NIM74531.1 S8 family serine peptidase [Gammaproteobacteria bacterium]NIO26364.1 S8 family serine peptidase [Gammaproteobacteria bacterium]NIO66916.1 S8 family serine peptidase [Gammaproteobacteria bacterium]NIP45226.1 S8 family serine peptidase [Gammaproteobacteria bacterium]
MHINECRVAIATAVLTLCALPALAQQAPLAATPEARLLAAVNAVCGGEGVHADGEEMAIPGATLLEKSPLVVRGREVGVRRQFSVIDSGDQMRLQTFEPGEGFRRITGEYWAPGAGAGEALQPHLLIVADGQCRVQTARRLVYDAGGKAEYLELLSATLDDVQTREALNPPVPEPAEAAGGATDTPAVRVALVDAGVNYLLPGIADRLARDSGGAIVGFDFWDLDRRPFDANPARSAFFPQRHGTQTASLLLREAPGAALVAYRYPRPDMTRMAELVEDAASAGVAVLNLSLGGNRVEEWQIFEQAAAAHPDMLFVVSAGNNGRDIDSQPVYPASLMLENMLVVSSADAQGRPAPGSNWGRTSVDLLVPAEGMLVTDFYGLPRVVSGSSYAAARVSALAACLLQAQPQWRAAELKDAILALAEAPDAEKAAYSVGGFLPDPGARERGGCAAMPRQIVETSRFTWMPEDLGTDAAPSGSTHALRPTVVIVEDAGWQLDVVREATAKAARVLAQCGIAVPEVTVRLVEGPERVKIFRYDWSTELVSRLDPARPAVFFVAGTLQDLPFEALALGRSNSRKRRALADTVWITAAIQDIDIGLAHELYHSLADSGEHDPDPTNLMYERTSGDNTTLRASQCLRLIRVGEAFGNLTRVQ